MASLTQWTWVWASCRSWWWTRKPGVLQPWGRKELDTTERLKWTELGVAEMHSTPAEPCVHQKKIDVYCCRHLQSVLCVVYTAVLWPKSPWFGLLLSSSHFEWRIRALLWMFHVSFCQDSQINEKMRSKLYYLTIMFSWSIKRNTGKLTKFYRTNFHIQTHNHSLNLLDYSQLVSTLWGFLDPSAVSI